jgi:hypothetical protein
MNPLNLYPHTDINNSAALGFSIVLATEKFTSILDFFGNWIAWAPTAISLKRIVLRGYGLTMPINIAVF